jgi:hypothetical protein
MWDAVNQGAGIGMRRGGKKLLYRACFGHAAGVKHGDACADLGHNAHVMCDEQNVRRRMVWNSRCDFGA